MERHKDNGNTMPKKLLFFDIDGTLVPFQGEIPESALLALKRAKAEGHLLVLCSGRGECSIPEPLLELGFDGLVAATGATIRYHGKRILTLSVGEKIHKLVKVLEECQAMYTLQLPEALFSPMRAVEWVRQKRLQEFKITLEEIHEDPAKYSGTGKVVVFYTPIPYPELARLLAPEFEVTGSSFDPADLNGCEITMTGINKSFAMQWLGEHLGISRENMIAFGDGPNDPDMLEFAGLGVAMGDAVPAAKAAADYITAPAAEDGIYKAMETIFGW